MGLLSASGPSRPRGSDLRCNHCTAIRVESPPLLRPPLQGQHQSRGPGRSAHAPLPASAVPHGNASTAFREAFGFEAQRARSQCEATGPGGFFRACCSHQNHSPCHTRRGRGGRGQGPGGREGGSSRTQQQREQRLLPHLQRPCLGLVMGAGGTHDTMSPSTGFSETFSARD